MSRFPLIPILVACASILAHKQLTKISSFSQYSVFPLLLAIAFGKLVKGEERRRTSGAGAYHLSPLCVCFLPGVYAVLRIILSTTCESDPLAETKKLMKSFRHQEKKQGINVDDVIDGYNRLQNDSCTSQTDRNSSYSTLVNAYYGKPGQPPFLLVNLHYSWRGGGEIGRNVFVFFLIPERKPV